MLIDTENCPSLFVRTAFGEENVDKKRKEKKKEIVCPFAAALNIAV